MIRVTPRERILLDALGAISMGKTEAYAERERLTTDGDLVQQIAEHAVAKATAIEIEEPLKEVEVTLKPNSKWREVGTVWYATRELMTDIDYPESVTLYAEGDFYRVNGHVMRKDELKGYYPSEKECLTAMKLTAERRLASVKRRIENLKEESK